MGSEEPQHTLSTVALFARLSPPALQHLANASRVRHYPARQVIWNEGDPGDVLLVLESGQLRISRFGVDGIEAVLAVVEPPAVLGELALLDGAPRDATVIAQRPVTVRLVPHQAFLDLLAREPSVVDALLASLAGMVRAANARHAHLVGLDVRGRLAAWLQGRAANSGIPGTVGSIAITLGRSQGELAAELSTTRSTLNRAFKDLETRGLLQVDGDRIIIPSLSALAANTR